MKEYEYSLEVKDLAPFIEYCKTNDFTLIETSQQTRTIYRNPNKTMARITVNNINGTIKKELDFKEDNWVEGAILKELRETMPLEFTDDLAVASILDFLNYKKGNTLIRIRHTYTKGNVKFELDEYTKPRVTAVVAIEGEKTAVDKIYTEIKETILNK